MKNLIFSSLCLLTLASISHAQSNQSALVVKHTDGTTTHFVLADRPKVSFSADSVYINANTVSFSYLVSAVANFTYENVGSGLHAADKDVAFRMEGNQVFFDGLSDNGYVFLCTMDGKRLPVRLTQSSKGLCLSLDGLHAGVYLLSVNGITAKFVKK